MSPEEERKLAAKIRHRRDERVLRGISDAVHAIAPCPDNGSVRPDYAELACAFKKEHDRWPLWWEMITLIQKFNEKT